MSPALESRNWRSSPRTAGSSPPSDSSPPASPTKSPRLHPKVDRCPVDGQVLHLGTSDSLPKDSVLRQRMGDKDFGKPWQHPVMVLSVDGPHVRCLQMTSKDIVKFSKCWHWASRYVPVAHANLAADKQHPTPEQPRLNLASGAQMRDASSVNVEKTIFVEWRNLEYFHNDRNLALEKESLVKLRKAMADFIPTPHSSPRTRPAGLSYSTNTSETRPRSDPERRTSRSPPLAWREFDLPKAGLPVASLSSPTPGTYVPPHVRFGGRTTTKCVS